MPVTLDRLRELRSDCLAEDLLCDESMCGWSEAQALTYYESGGVELPDERRYPRVWLTSDVHTDRENNMEWCRRLPRHPHGDVLIVAGDLSHRLEIIEETLKIFLDRFSRVFFIPGNHDLWMNSHDPPGSNSVDKIAAILALCDKLGVSTRAELLGEDGKLLSAARDRRSRSLRSYMASMPSAMVSSTVQTVQNVSHTVSSTASLAYELIAQRSSGPGKLAPDFGGAPSEESHADAADGDEPTPGLWIVPLHSWYDLSLDLTRIDPSLSEHAEGMSHFSWSDFALCKWPRAWVDVGHDTLTGSYPSRVAAGLAELNTTTIARVNLQLKKRRGDAVFSFSHFLPRAQTLPDWLEPQTEEFDHSWLDHPAGSTAVKFSRVRALSDGVPRGGARDLLQMHAFGHSHRPKDLTLHGVRYVSFPLGYGKEREKRLVPEV